VAPSAQELLKRLSPSVFVVEALNERGSVVAIGSAVAVAPGEVVTNKHVVEAGTAWRVRQGRKTWPATLIHFDMDHDLCQLKADGLKAPPVLVRTSSTLAVGERVYAIGAPKGLELTFSEGVISGLREYEQARLVQTSAAISPGSSGGGLFDAQGRLVGITTMFLKEGQNLNFALPGELVQALANAPPKPRCVWPAEPMPTTDGPLWVYCVVWAPPSSPPLSELDKHEIKKMGIIWSNFVNIQIMWRAATAPKDQEEGRKLLETMLGPDPNFFRDRRSRFCGRHPEMRVVDIDGVDSYPTMDPVPSAAKPCKEK